MLILNIKYLLILLIFDRIILDHMEISGYKFYFRGGIIMRKLFSCNKEYFICFMMLVFMVILTLPTATSANEMQENTNSEYAVGDINRDGVVNSLDYAMLRAFLLGKNGYGDVEQRIWEADVNGDDLINSLDFAAFRLWLVKGIEFPKGRRINTYITTVKEEPLDLIAYHSPLVVLEFSVILRDEAGNPLAGKKVRCNMYGVSYVENPTVTDENGCATFSFRVPHTDQVPFATFEKNIPVYFDGDEEYNASEYIIKAIMSNNGGPQRTPTPTPTPR